MNSVLLRCPIKPGKLADYKSFISKCLERSEEYADMLHRYDMHSVKIWHGEHGGQHYAYVMHKVGKHYYDKIKQWEYSTHVFDEWFREALKDIYDMVDSTGMLELDQLAEFLD